MNPSELGGLEHENMIEALELAGDNAEGALIHRAGGVVLIATGLPNRGCWIRDARVHPAGHRESGHGRSYRRRRLRRLHGWRAGSDRPRRANRTDYRRLQRRHNPAARRHGHGAAMSTRIAVDGAAAGCDVAVLQASDMGYPIYERLGYRTVVRYMGNVDPTSLPPPDPAPPNG